MNRPTIRQLEYLVAVADHLNFRQAAERCFVSQPALSSQIAALEKTLGARLFERDRRKVLITEAGRRVAREARTLLEQTDHLIASAHDAAGPLQGRLRLGVIPTVAPYYLARAIPLLRRRYPKLQIVLQEDHTARLIELLSDGRLDMCLLALEAELGDTDQYPLFADPFLLAAHKGHPLLEHKQLQEKDLRNQEVLLLDDGHCLRNQALSICHRVGARETEAFRATSLGTCIQMVAADMGVTLLPGLAAEHELRGRRQLAIRPFKRPGPSRTIGLCWRRTSDRSVAWQKLGHELAQQVPPGCTPIKRGR